MRIPCFFFFLLLTILTAKAQDESPGQRSFGVQSSFAVSFSGYSVSLAGVYKVAYNEFHLGPVLSLGNSYLPDKGPWGLNAGWKYHYARHKNIGAFVMLDYRNAFYRPFNPLDKDISGLNSIHELNLAMGIKWQFVPLLYFNAAIGTGIYYERIHDVIGDHLVTHSGYSNLVKASILKQFKR